MHLVGEQGLLKLTILIYSSILMLQNTLVGWNLQWFVRIHVYVPVLITV